MGKMFIVYMYGIVALERSLRGRVLSRSLPAALCSALTPSLTPAQGWPNACLKENPHDGILTVGWPSECPKEYLSNSGRTPAVDG